MTMTISGSTGLTFPDDSVQALGSYTGFKNRIINGDCRIDQRNAGASVTPATSSTYNLDRWITNFTQASKFSIQQNAGSVTPPNGFANYLGITSTSSYSVLTGDFFSVGTNIEGFNTADLNWGTANAATVTLSFWVRSSLTGTFGGSFSNGAANRSYPFTYTISSANTWTQISITVAGDTTGTWVGATNGVGMRIYFGLGSGSTYAGTAGAWSSNTFLSATGATSVVGTNGATFYITGVQLEKGSTATSFDYRPYGTELALCQRYYVQFNRLQASNTAIGSGIQTSNTTGDVMIPLPVTLRTTPTASGSLAITDTYSYLTGAIISSIRYTQCSAVDIDFSNSSVGAQGRTALAMVSSTTTFGLSSEL